MGLPIVVAGVVVVAPLLFHLVMRLCDPSLRAEFSTMFLVSLVASAGYLAMAYFPAEGIPAAAPPAVLLLLVALLLMHVSGTTFGRAVLATMIYGVAWSLLLAALASVATRVEPNGSVTEDIKRVSRLRR